MCQRLKGLAEKASMMVAVRRRTARKKMPMQPTVVGVDEGGEDETATLVMSARRRESERVDGKSTTGPDNPWVAAAVLEEDSAMLD